MAKSKSQTETEPEGNEESTPPESDGSLRVKYTGPEVHTRILEGRDFSAAGISDVTKKEWSAENNHTVDFSQYEGDKEALTRFLMEGPLKGEFKVLEPGEL